MAKSKKGQGRASKKAVKRKPAKRKPRPGRAKLGKANTVAGTASLAKELNAVRAKILQNETVLQKKIDEKTRAENALGKLLKKRFSEEKVILAMVKSSSAMKQTGLKEKISSLKKINSVFEEKKSRIDEAKKRHTALKKQLALIEKRAGA